MINPGNIGIDTRDDSGQLFEVIRVNPGRLTLARLSDRKLESRDPAYFWVLLDALPA